MSPHVTHRWILLDVARHLFPTYARCTVTKCGATTGELQKEERRAERKRGYYYLQNFCDLPVCVYKPHSGRLLGLLWELIMKPRPLEVWALVNLSIVLTGLRLVGAQQQQNDYPAMDYGQDYNQGETSILCYVCTYHVRQGHTSGLENCRDPFYKYSIPEVECQGPCAKIYSKAGDTEYTINRSCLPNCKDMSDELGYTECCYNSLCNGAQPNASSQRHLLASLISLVLLITLLRLT